MKKKKPTKAWLCKRDKYLKRTYGISLSDYEVMELLQYSQCWICQKHKSQFKSSLAVDHNHKTGKVRGLLCYRCNKFVVGRHNLESATKLYQYMVHFEAEGK